MGFADLIETTPQGLYCPAGDFHIDPWQAVERCVITHAHGDHARAGSGRYLCAQAGEAVLRERIGAAAPLRPLAYGENIAINDVRVSLHPAGHVLGSAQVRIERRGRVVVVTGDYKRQPDPTCAPFEPLHCHALVTEATFGLPIYRWPAPERVFDGINTWWRSNRAVQRTSVIFAYALGKAQRILHHLDAAIGPILVHGAIARFLPAYAAAGVALPPTLTTSQADVRPVRGRGLVLAPPSARHTPWLRKFGRLSLAFASGWMQIRGARRRRAVDRGFVLSDHVDWPGLLETIRESKAEAIGVTHGYTAPLARYLREIGYQVEVLPTRYGDEEMLESEAEVAPAAGEPHLIEPDPDSTT